jgi:hypothetical protein
VSSSFLFLGIIAVWAFFLVPRWLRRHHAQPQVELDVAVDVEFAADYRAADYDDSAAEDYGEYQDTPATGDYSYAEHAELHAAGRAAPVSRSRVLRSRRRLLTMLVLLSAAAAACTVLKLTSWWVCIPPAGLLGSYLLLLREAALADAEQARRRAAMELRVQAARQRAQAAAQEYDEQPSAQIIDISARVGDQLYDQYADATVRAVGD